MAYAFNRVMNLLDPESQMPNEQQAPQGSTESADSSSAGGGQQAPQAQPGQQAQPQASAGARGRVMAKNVGKAQAPTDLNKVSTNIGQAKQNIQNEANAYMQSATQPYQSNAGEEVQSYMKGENQDLGSRLRAAPGLMEDIKLSETKINDVDLLQNDAGIRELFRRSQGPEGTAGEAALDTALLRRNKDFDTKRSDVLGSYQDLLKERAGIEETSRSKAQEARVKAADAWKESVLGAAKGQVTSLDDMAKQREAEFDAQIAAAEEARRIQAYEAAQAYADQLAGGYSDPFMQEAIRNSFGAGTLDQNILDPYEYYKPSGLSADQTDYTQFYGEPEAQQFERLMGLLGGGETRMAGPYAGKSAKDVITGSGLDENALKDAILGRAGAASGEYRSNKQAMDQETAARAAGKAQAEQNRKDEAAFYAPETPKEKAARLNKDESEWTDRDRYWNKKENEQIKKNQEKRGLR